MSSRDYILSKIKAASETHNPSGDRAAVVEARIADHPRGIIPEQTLTPTALLRRFSQKVRASAGTLETCKSGDLKKVVTRYLRDHNLPARVRIGKDRRLNKLKAAGGSLLEVEQGASHGDDLACVSHAMGGVAESGTLFLASGPNNPTTLNFLPEHHIVVVNAKNVTGSYEELISSVRKTYGSGNMPRALNMITGPSRSGDIEQTLILGAHGPLALHVIVVKD